MDLKARIPYLFERRSDWLYNHSNVVEISITLLEQMQKYDKRDFRMEPAETTFYDFRTLELFLRDTFPGIDVLLQ